MATSAYLPDEIRNYQKEHDLEVKISNAVNSTIKDMPEDPNSFISMFFSNLASDKISLESLDAHEITLINDLRTFEVTMTIEYKSKKFNFKYIHQPPIDYLHDENILKEHFEDNSVATLEFDQDIICKKIREELSLHLLGKDISSLKEFCDELHAYSALNNDKVNNLIMPISYMPPVIIAFLNQQHIYQTIKTIIDPKATDDDSLGPMPTIFHRCLVGGHTRNSKCKINIQYIYIEEEKEISFKEAYERIRKTTVAIRKLIGGGKAGESAIKIQPDGAFLCPHDTIHENVKLVDDAIVQCGYKESVFIRLDLDADSFYQAEHKKYDFENPKKPSELEEMEDAVQKIVHERPAIKILEDPFCSSENVSWHRFNKKLVDKGLTIKYASKKWYNTSESIEAFAVPLNKDDFPNVKPPDLIDRINENLATIDFFAFSISDCSTLYKVFEVLKEKNSQLKPQGVEVILSDGLYSLRDDYFLELVLGLELKNCSYGLPSNAERVDSINRFLNVLQKKSDPFDHVMSANNMGSDNKLESDVKLGSVISDGVQSKKTGVGSLLSDAKK